MSILTLEPATEEKNMSTSNAETAATSTRAAFTHQTGQALVTLGLIFKHVPPFNENIEQRTGETLILIGKKLKGIK